MAAKALLVDGLERLAGLQLDLKSYRTLIIWDAFSLDPKIKNHLIECDIIYLPMLINQKGQELHDEYVTWVANASFHSPNKKRNIKLFEIADNRSIWWGSLVNEKCNLVKSPNIQTTIKIMALYKFVDFSKISTLDLCIFSRTNYLSHIQDICRMKGVEIVDLSSSRQSRFAYLCCMLNAYKIRSFYVYCLGMLWLSRSLLASRFIHNSELSKSSLLPNINSKSIFIGYTTGLQNSEYKSGIMTRNTYWGGLPGRINEVQTKSCWVYIYVRDSFFRRLADASKYIANINSFSPNQSHVILNQLFTLRLFLKASLIMVRMFFRLSCISQREALPEWHGIRINDLHYHDYICSAFGVVAAKNIYYQLLFDKLFSLIGHQDNLVYLQENMEWEFSALQSARSFNVGRIIGFPHTTVSFWDLRYSYARNHKDTNLPLPDCIGVSGNLVRKSLIEKNSFIAKRLVDVEALRYTSLMQSNSLPGCNRADHLKGNNICVLGTIVETETISLLYFVKETLWHLRNLGVGPNCTIKFHPLCDLTPLANKLFGASVSIEYSTMDVALQRASIVICGLQTSSCIDAVVRGLKVFVFLDESSLIVNPLYNTGIAEFVSSPKDVAFKIQELARDRFPLSLSIPEPKDFFSLDPSLSLWLKLLCDESGA
jgi:surface carbohydrate biosynthesis protein (TIGR04326 family)